MRADASAHLQGPGASDWGGQVSPPPPPRQTRCDSSQELQLELAAWLRRCGAFTEHQRINMSQRGAGHQNRGREQKRPLNGEKSDSVSEIFQRFRLCVASTTIYRYYLAAPRLRPPTSDLHRGILQSLTFPSLTQTRAGAVIDPSDGPAANLPGEPTVFLSSVRCNYPQNKHILDSG